MIGSSIRGDNQMIYGLTYVFLLCMFFCVFTQLHFLALGLRFFDALYVVPVFQCFFISVSTLGGAGQWERKEREDDGACLRLQFLTLLFVSLPSTYPAYFGEFGSFGALQIAFFPIGIFLTLSGVYILSSRDMKKNAARGGVNGEVSEVAVSVDGEIPLSERASGLRPSDAIHLEGDSARHGLPHGDSAANQLDEPSRTGRADDDVRPFAAGMTSSDDPEEVEVMQTGGTASKYVVPSSGAQAIARRPPPPDREYPVAASMPAQMFVHTHNANGAYNGNGSGQYPPPPPLPSGSSRPSTAGEKRMSRFAQRQSRAASRAGEPGVGGMFAGALAAHAEWRANGSASGQWPAAGSSGQFPARNRTRSTWSAADHSRGSVFHAGLAVLGAIGPPDEQ